MPRDEDKPRKAKNPEEALKASVARDIKIRLMNDAVKAQQLHLAYARWENALASKDLVAARKRSEKVGQDDGQLTNKNIKFVRKQKLEALYHDDELRYEEELAEKGLAFRRIRA
jgi:hypothetical protein